MHVFIGDRLKNVNVKEKKSQYYKMFCNILNFCVSIIIVKVGTLRLNKA